jgi:hypothetical protein
MEKAIFIENGIDAIYLASLRVSCFRRTCVDSVQSLDILTEQY